MSIKFYLAILLMILVSGAFYIGTLENRQEITGEEYHDVTYGLTREICPVTYQTHIKPIMELSRSINNSQFKEMKRKCYREELLTTMALMPIKNRE